MRHSRQEPETVEIEVWVLHQTDRAVLVTEEPPNVLRRPQVWVPFSQIANFNDRLDPSHRGSIIATFDCPMWLALDKGFI